MLRIVASDASNLLLVSKVNRYVGACVQIA